VRQNKTRALKAIGLAENSTYDVYQVHSTDIVVVNRPIKSGESHIKADGMITQHSKLTLLMRFADCVPILLVDPVQHAIAIIHAGWLGTINRIVEKAVRMLNTNFRSDPGDIYAGIGPSIGPDHYQVGSDVLEKLRSSFGSISDQFIVLNHDKTYFDLWKANQFILNEVGIDKIEISNICTQCNTDDWYSHRGEKGKTGRFGAVIGLE
jgi:YfiH family protein